MHPDPMATPLGTHIELSTHLIARALVERGAELHWLRRAFFLAHIGGRTLAVNQTRTDLTSATAVELCGRKDYTRGVLQRAGVATADGGSYRPDQYDRALRRAAQVGWPVIVKPAGGKKGRGVAAASDPDEFAAAWEGASGGAKVVVERRHVGDEARFLVVAGRCVAVAGRRPPHVIGDGTSTVSELIDAKNTARGENPHLASRPIPRVGDLDRVPGTGEHVAVNPGGPANFAAGGDSVDMTGHVHPTYLDVAAAAQQAIPGLGVAGVDIIAADWSRPAAPDNHIVVEVNSRPAIGGHHFPWEGKPRDAAGAIVDALLSRH
ncbi:hypothetical protein [Mycolicibacterium sp.]|uniref:ATP-binding protein n=1 Tax=Mycolicibacterium sp. TaxID=2320850 RepID=UPI003560FEA9